MKDSFKGASFNGCFAVMDGHGGQRAAEFARQRLGDLLEDHAELETNVHGSIKQGKLQTQIDRSLSILDPLESSRDRPQNQMTKK